MIKFINLKINIYKKIKMKFIIYLGGGLIAFSTLGKGMFKLARILRTKTQAVKGEVGKYYKGGFDDKMTRREAVLILNVRDNASKEELKDAHRKILMLNHPDNGGSTYIASKINEAKDLLYKTAQEKSFERSNNSKYKH